MSSCVHHWLLPAPTPGSEFVTGVCKKCGLEREHRAFLSGEQEALLAIMINNKVESVPPSWKKKGEVS